MPPILHTLDDDGVQLILDCEGVHWLQLVASRSPVE